MKGTRHSEEQIITILKQGEAGLAHGGVVPAARHHGTDLLPLEGEVRRDGQRRSQEAEATGGREPEAEACGGRSNVGQPGSERRSFKKLVEPAGLRAAARYAMEQYQMSERHACRLMGLARSTHRYRERKAGRDSELRQRLKELAAKRMRFGYRRLTAMLVREGIEVNHKRVYRLYREEGLAMRIRQRRRIRWKGAVNQAGSNQSRMNGGRSIFVSDCVSTGRVIRMLTMVDDYTRECPTIEVDTSLGGLRVRRVLDRVAAERGLPEAIVLDNGPEFRGRALAAWSEERGSAVGVHSARQAGAERLRGKLQWPAAR